MTLGVDFLQPWTLLLLPLPFCRSCAGDATR
jgi:hypothetical protein